RLDFRRSTLREQHRMAEEKEARATLSLSERGPRHAGFFQDTPRYGPVVGAAYGVGRHFVGVRDAVNVGVPSAAGEWHRKVDEVSREPEFPRAAAAAVAAFDVVAGRLSLLPHPAAVKSGEQQSSVECFPIGREDVVLSLHARGKKLRLGK